jgi:hypothetical protein
MTSPLGWHSFKGGVAAGTLSALCGSADTSIDINTIVVANWPSLATGPFKIVIDQGQATEESMLVTALTTTTATVTRAYDGSTAYAHANGATFYTAPEALAMQDVVNHVYDTTRNDHTQYMLSASLVSGYGLTAMPTPAVAIVYDFNKPASPVTIGSSGLTTMVTTDSLAVGTWIILAGASVTMPASVGTVTMEITEGTGVGSYEAIGSLVGALAGVEGADLPISLFAILIVTTAGTFHIAINNTASATGTALATSTNDTYASGYLAFRVA